MRKTIYLGLAVYVLLVTAILFVSFKDRVSDDPYITYRYAYNLVNRSVLEFNPGERVLSTTTPLFTLLLALSTILWHDIPHIAILIGAVSLPLGGICFYLLSTRWGNSAVGWTGLALYPGFLLLVSLLGFEHPLYLAFCLAAFVSFAGQNWMLTAVFAALASVTRPDGFLLSIVLACGYWILYHKAGFPWKALALFAAIVLPWYGFAWIYYGSPIPNTLFAKQQQGAMMISQRFSSGILTFGAAYAKSWPYLIEIGLAFTGLVNLILRARKWVIILVWAVIYYLAYSLLGVSRYPWYYAPLIPGLLILVGLGIDGLQYLAARSLPRFNRVRFPQILTITLISILFVGQMLWLYNLRSQPDQRGITYRQAGEWIKENLPPESTVGALEVGVLGYYSDRNMIDFAGLIQPEVARHLTPQSTYQDSAFWSIKHYHPAYFVLYKGQFPLIEKTYAANKCQKIKVFRTTLDSEPAQLIIYSCQQ